MKTALVTGGNRGIGLAMCQGLAAQGYKVLLGSRDMAAGQQAAAQINGDVTPVEMDVSVPASIDTVLRFYGADIDVLMNNAGILDRTPLRQDARSYRENMKVMVDGPYLLMKGVIPHMEAKGYGRIVNTSSQWGAFGSGLHGPGAYGVAKAALNALTLALSREVQHDNVKINCFCPGWVHTRMGGDQAPRTPEEGADTGLWLATLPDDGPTGGFFQTRKPLAW